MASSYFRNVLERKNTFKNIISLKYPIKHSESKVYLLEKADFTAQDKIGNRYSVFREKHYLHNPAFVIC